jgi:hypothetical protein
MEEWLPGTGRIVGTPEITQFSPLARNARNIPKIKMGKC